MIEKIPDKIPVQTGEWRGTTFDIIPKETFGMACRKINELCDAVNGMLYWHENLSRFWQNLSQKENTENAYTKTCRMDKEFAEEECKRLQNDLERTRKALTVATERLEQIAHESFQGDQQSINLGFHIRAAAALTDIEQITALEQKD